MGHEETVKAARAYFEKYRDHYEKRVRERKEEERRRSIRKELADQLNSWRRSGKE